MSINQEKHYNAKIWAIAFVAIYNNNLREHNTSKSTSFKCFSDSLQ